VTAAGTRTERVRRLPRAQRREQILAAATRAFARNGFAATGLDDIAAEAGTYQNFENLDAALAIATTLEMGPLAQHCRASLSA